MIKILHILNTPRAEGTPRLVLDWLSVPGYQQEVFALHHSPEDLTEALREASAWYGESNLLSYGKSKFPRIVKETRRVCSERRPDVVIIWVAGFSNFISLGCRLAGVKRIVAHAGNPSAFGLTAAIRCNMVILPLAALGTQLICCSAYVKSTIEKVTWWRPKLHSVWNCTQGEAFAYRAAKARVSKPASALKYGLMVATLEDHKDHRTLLEAVRKITNTHPEFRLRLVGEGSLRQAISTQIHALGLEDVVEVLGARHDVAELMGQSDVFVFATTHQEGLGSVLFEAMAAELPILASDVPACREILQDGRRGNLVPPYDADAFAKALSAFLQSPKDDAALASHREFSCSWTPERMLNTYLQLAGLGTSEPRKES